MKRLQIRHRSISAILLWLFYLLPVNAQNDLSLTVSGVSFHQKNHYIYNALLINADENKTCARGFGISVNYTRRLYSYNNFHLKMDIGIGHQWHSIPDFSREVDGNGQSYEESVDLRWMKTFFGPEIWYKDFIGVQMAYHYSKIIERNFNSDYQKELFDVCEIINSHNPDFHGLTFSLKTRWKFLGVRYQFTNYNGRVFKYPLQNERCIDDNAMTLSSHELGLSYLLNF